MRLMSRSRAAVAALVSLAIGACSHAEAKKVPSKVTAFEGKDVVLDVRAASYEKGQLTFDAVVGNNEPSAVVALRVEITVTGPGGSAVKTLDLTPVGTRAKLTVLEPSYEVAIHEVMKLEQAPESVTARVVSAETFAEPADPPALLEVLGDAQGLEFASLGHFRFDLGGDASELPFRASIGIRNNGGKVAKRVEYGIVFLDDQGKEADRVPMSRAFEPALLPGDAVIDTVNSQVRAFDKVRIEVRAVHGE